MPLEAKDSEIMDMSIDFQGFQERAEGYKTLISNLCGEIDHLVEINIQQKEVIETQVEQIFNLHIEAEQAQADTRERDKLLEKIHELDHVIKRNHILNKNLSLELQEALEKEESLTKQKDSILKEMEQLKMFLERKNSENNHLLVQVEELQEKNSILDIKNKMLSAEVSDLELLNERKDGEFGVLKKELFTLKHQTIEPTSEATVPESNLEKPESPKQKSDPEVKSLGRNQELQEDGGDQSEHGSPAAAETGAEETKKPKTGEEVEQYNVLQAKLLVVGKDELIAKQLQQIAYKKELLNELHIHNIRFRESLTELKTRLMKKQEDDIIGPEIRAECGTQITPHLTARAVPPPRRLRARIRAVGGAISKAASRLKPSCRCCRSSKNQVHPSRRVETEAEQIAP